jgi:VIT1/CCC1 family predicted Fe2+/Mn2+ transporter
MSLTTKTFASSRSESGRPEAALNSSVLDRMMDAMTFPFLNGHRAESIKNRRKVHPGAFVFSIALVLSMALPEALAHSSFSQNIQTEIHNTL